MYFAPGGAVLETAPARADLAGPANGVPIAASANAVIEDDPPPRIPPQIDPAHLHFTPSQVAVGAAAPDFTLPRTGGKGDLTLSSLRGKPVVLVFGSFT